MTYRCLKAHEFSLDDWTLVPIRQEEMESIRKWRNAQIHILRQKKPLSYQEQQDYFEKTILPQFSMKEPPQVLFLLLYKGVCIGYGGVTHIDWDHKRGEVSFLLKDPANDFMLHFEKFLILLKRVVFDDLKLHRLFSETYDIRPEVVRVLEQSGFAFEGRLKEHVLIDGKWVDSLIHGILAINK